MRSLFDRNGTTPDRAPVLAGWWPLVVCAALFVAIHAVLRVGDLLTLLGFVAVLSASAFLMVPASLLVPAQKKRA